jgi:UDP-glucose 4-epimerase
MTLLSNDNSLVVVIVGGSGFLGSHVADKLTEAGHHLRIYDQTDSPWKKQLRG